MKKLGLLTLALAALALTGCQSKLMQTKWGNTTIGRYLEDRGRDTLDMVPVNISAGNGFYVGARATSVLGTGIGWAETERMGWARRKRYQGEPDETALAGYLQWSEKQHGVLLWWQRDDDPQGGAGNSMLFIPMKNKPQPEYTFDLGSAADFEFEVHVAIVGFRLGLSPVQFADWLLGWFKLDFLDDDLNKIQDDAKAGGAAPASKAASAQ